MLNNEEIAEGLEFLWLQVKIVKTGIRDDRVLERLDLVEGILCESLIIVSDDIEWFNDVVQNAGNEAGEPSEDFECCGRGCCGEGQPQ